MAATRASEMANASNCFSCVLCGSQLRSCKERRLLTSEQSCHVIPTAIRLLRDCVPGNDQQLANSDAEALLRISDKSYLCKRPCYAQLEKIDKLEGELDSIKRELKEKMKAVHEEELTKRATDAIAEVEGPIMLPLKRRRLVFSRGSTAATSSPSVTVSY